jgi:hypothetical protein
MLLRSHRQQPLEGSWHIVNVPVHDGTTRAARRTFGRVAAIDQAQLVLVVAEAKLDISRPRPVVPGVSGRDDPTVELGAFEVRVDAQQLSVPLLCRLKIVRPIVNGGESSQHLCSLRRREYLSATVTGRAVSDHP